MKKVLNTKLWRHYFGQLNWEKSVFNWLKFVIETKSWNNYIFQTSELWNDCVMLCDLFLWLRLCKRSDIKSRICKEWTVLNTQIVYLIEILDKEIFKKTTIVILRSMAVPGVGFVVSLYIVTCIFIVTKHLI